MKKYILVSLIATVIPLTAFASWWNPLSWHIFSSLSQTSPQVQIISTTTLPSKVVTRVATSTITVKSPTKKVVQKVSQPAVASSTPSQSQQPTPPIGTLCNGTYWNKCPAGQNLICPQTGNAYCQPPQQPVSQPNQVVSHQPISIPVSSVQNTVSQVTQNQQPTKQTNQNIVEVGGSIKVTPTTVHGGTTVAFTITAPGTYHFGTDSTNTGNRACITSGNKQTCVGVTSSDGSSLTESSDGKILTYTTLVPDNQSANYQISTSGLYNSTNKFLDRSYANWSIGVTNSDSAFNTGKATVANNPNTPSGQVTVTDGISGRYPVQIIDISGYYQNLQLQSLVAHINTSGTGTITGAYLVSGSMQLAGATVTNGLANFSHISAEIYGNPTMPLIVTLKLDVTGVSSTSPLSITSSVNGSDVAVVSGQDYSTVVTSGSAVGNTITVVGQ